VIVLEWQGRQWIIPAYETMEGARIISEVDCYFPPAPFHPLRGRAVNRGLASQSPLSKNSYAVITMIVEKSGRAPKLEAGVMGTQQTLIRVILAKLQWAARNILEQRGPAQPPRLRRNESDR
jgi:hypothetical protein